MTNPTVILYYRTPTTRAIDPGYTTPILLATNAPTQAIQFITPGDMLERWSKSYANNITQQSLPNNKGNRTVSTIDNGLSSVLATIMGRFTTPDVDADALKLEQFAAQLQYDTYHQWGNVGLYSDNTPRYNLDPSPTRGFMIKTFDYSRVSQKPQSLEFTMQLAYGGTYVPT